MSLKPRVNVTVTQSGMPLLLNEGQKFMSSITASGEALKIVMILLKMHTES